MIVRLRSFGGLENYLGGKSIEVQLPEAATLRHLWATIDVRFGSSLPNDHWDREQKRFRPSVTVMISGVDPDDEYQLSDQQEIFLLPPMIGG